MKLKSSKSSYMDPKLNSYLGHMAKDEHQARGHNLSVGSENPSGLSKSLGRRRRTASSLSNFSKRGRPLKASVGGY